MLSKTKPLYIQGCEKTKKKTWFVYSPLAIRLRTESERCVDGSSPCVVTALTATEEKDSDVLKERYSCIMYSGYLLRWFTDRFLSAKLASRPAWYLSPWVERDKTPEEQKRNVQKTVKTLTSIFIKKPQNLLQQWGQKKERSPRLVPSSSWFQAGMMLCADGAPVRPLYSGQLPFDDPWPLQASEQPLWSPEHITGQKKENI